MSSRKSKTKTSSPQDAEVLARRKFGLGEIFDITFSSFNLGSSNGRRVEIDESAWQIVHPLLDEIIVTESQAVNAKRKSCHQMNNGHPAHIVSIKTEEEVGNVGRGGDYWQDDEVTPSVKNGASSDQESLWDDGFRFGEEDESCVEQSARRYDGDTTITEQRVGVVGAPGYGEWHCIRAVLCVSDKYRAVSSFSTAYAKFQR
jgi:hypothetical protein